MPLPALARARTRWGAAITVALLALGGTVASPAFATEASAPTVTVSPATDIDSTVEATLVVSGSGFTGVEPVSVALVAEADWIASGAASTPVLSVNAEAIVEGGFESTLLVAAGTLDPAVSYGVATFAATEREYDTFTPITLAPLAPEEVAVDGVVDEVVEDAPVTAARQASFSTVPAGNVKGGTATWGVSSYLNSSNPGRPNPLASAYIAPAAFTPATALSSWGAAIGTVNPDGSADLAFDGTSVNFAPTSGAFLRLSDLEAHLDASGNGSVTAVVEHGTAPGVYPGITYDPAQAGAFGPQRVTVVTLEGNTAGASRDADGATWTGLAGSWSPEFTTALTGWIYAGQVSSATGRTPSTFSFSVAVDPVAAPTAYDTGSAAWGLSEYLNSANPGRPNPLPSAYTAPASFDATSRITTWGGGTGSIAADGTATLAFQGTSVNFASTGGGWLRLADVQATLDAAGNGAVTAVVSHGTSVTGTRGNYTFDPGQAPAAGPQRVTVVTLSGNTVPVTQTANSATWSGLSGSWSSEFTSLLAGWTYASTVTSAAGRAPTTFDFTLGITPPAVTPTITLTASPTASVVVGTSATLTATVDPAAAGVVEFRNSGSLLGSSTVVGGVATFDASALAAGSYSIVASFVPTNPAEFTAADSPALAFTVSAPVVVRPGSLSWGVRGSLQSYVLGGGSITTAAGAGAEGSAFLFPQESSAGFDQSTGTGTSSYRGQVTFAYPAHGFSITLANPRVRVASVSSGSLIVDVTYNGSTTYGVDFARLFIGGGSRSVDGATTTFAGVPAALTSAGASAFQGFYGAGESLDPVTFVVGSAAASFAPASASAVTPATFTPPATPPATTGVVVDPRSLENLSAGGEVTITASGFQPNESGIAVVIYSDPIVLARDLTADASGTVTWTGRLPANLTGTHTLTVQGSVARGVVLDIPSAAQVGCPVDAASLTWGFKESFRSYISGSIANGEWIVADGATYEVPDFGWSSGTGTYDPETAEGTLAFEGSIRFTGHGGVLDTTVANPQLRFIDADTALLTLDVFGTTQDGAPVDRQHVEFVTLDLTSSEIVDGVLTGTAAATLTDAGADAFGTYPAGEAFDDVSFAFPVADDCATPAAAADVSEDVDPIETSAAGAPGLWWILWVALALLLAAVVAALIVRRRNRTA